MRFGSSKVIPFALALCGAEVIGSGCGGLSGGGPSALRQVDDATARASASNANGIARDATAGTGGTGRVRDSSVEIGGAGGAGDAMTTTREDSGQSFACGSATRCNAGAQYCLAFAAGTGGPYYACKPIPTSCATDPACACVEPAANLHCSGCEGCTESDAGLRLWVFYP